SLSDCGTINSDKRAFGASAVTMNGPRHQLFARTALALYQHGGIGRRHPPDEFINLAHRSTLSDHVVFKVNFGPQKKILLLQLFELPDVLESQAGDAGDGCHYLKVVLVEMFRW